MEKQDIVLEKLSDEQKIHRLLAYAGELQVLRKFDTSAERFDNDKNKKSV